MFETNEVGLHLEDLCVVDVETSGLDAGINEIIQLACLHVASRSEFEIKMKFDIKKADQRALEINKYSEEVWEREAVSQRRGCKKFANWLCQFSSCNKVSKNNNKYKTSVLGGYNVNAFDKFFIVNWFQKQNIFLPADYRFYDFYPLTMIMNPMCTSYTLEDMNDEMNLPSYESHDALNDVYMTTNIAGTILDELFQDGDLRKPNWASEISNETKIPF